MPATISVLKVLPIFVIPKYLSTLPTFCAEPFCVFSIIENLLIKIFSLFYHGDNAEIYEKIKNVEFLRNDNKFYVQNPVKARIQTIVVHLR